MDVSEVLFNELAFFKLMEDFKGCVCTCMYLPDFPPHYCVCCRHPQLNGDFRSVTSSQTTTEPEDSSFAECEGEGGEEGQGGGGSKPAPSQAVGGRSHSKPLDPTLLQVLSFAANLTLQEEEDTLGKVRERLAW